MKTIWGLVGQLVFWLLWPALYLYLRRDQRTRVIIICGDNILLVKGFLGKSHWILPGGGVHAGEIPEDGAVREVKEETGITIMPSDLVRIGKGVANEYGLRFDYISFKVEVPELIPPKRQKWELVDAAWLPLPGILQRTDLSPETRRILSTWRVGS